ncbi:MAG: glycosyltransferase family 4 protein [Candidatus Binatia bacterium]
MRTLILCHEYPPVGGGAGAVCAALGRGYVRAGHKATVVTMGFEGLDEREKIEGVEVHRISCGRRRKDMASPWEGLHWAWRCWPIARRLHAEHLFDVVHAHFIMPAGIVARRLKRESGVPFIITPHGSDVPGYNRERLKLAHVLVRPWWRRICKDADRITSPSASLLKLIEARARHVKAEIIPNGFQPGRFRPLEKEKRILLCSRLVERKGFHYFLEAIQDVNLPGWQVDLVGDGPMFERLASMANRCKVPVHMHGWIDNHDPKLAELYGRAMIFVFPSEWENFSIALLEAIGAGCAVITSDIAGNPEAIGNTGYLIKPKDVGAMRRATIALTGDVERCLDLGRRASERAAAFFDWKIIAKRYIELLQSLVAPNGGEQ